MTVFWIVAALLVIVALAFLLPPLLGWRRACSGGHAAMNVELYREQFAELERDLQGGVLSGEQYVESKRELERRMLEDAGQSDAALVASASNRPLAIGLVIVLPLVAVLLYLQIGSPQAIVPRQDAAAHGMAAGHAGGDAQFAKLVEKLEARLRDQTPDDAAGWQLLARSYVEMRRFADAARAFDKATQLQPGDAQLLADYADAQAMANGQRFDGKPDELIKQALAANPTHPKALMLAGSSAFVRKDYRQALSYWEPLQKLLPPDSDEAREIGMNIAEAKSLLKPGEKVDAPLDNLADFSAGKGTAAAAAGASVSGVVSLSPALAAKAAPGDKLRVFARAANGPKMPLAIAEAQVKDLPFKFTLTDAMAMMPQMKLSNFPEIVVVARITKAGGAQAQSGDLQGMSGTVKVGAKEVPVTIDTVVP